MGKSDFVQKVGGNRSPGPHGGCAYETNRQTYLVVLSTILYELSSLDIYR
jgi:hypothetical protein